MIRIRKSDERGKHQLSWLDSKHSFSFGTYYDPEHMGVSVLRVINDDKVKPGAGFATHSHEDMEIISYIKRGEIEHKDSMGNTKQIPAGEFQLMSAGQGISHSEYNPAADEMLEFLQIWIEPNEYGIEPVYQQKKFDTKDGLQLIVSPLGESDSLKIHQNAYLYRLLMQSGETLEYAIDPGRTVYIHMVSGTIEVNGQEINPGDGMMIKDEQRIIWTGVSSSEALIFDLP